MFFLVWILGLLVTSSAQRNNDIRDGICREYNTYYKINGSCDTYIECNAHKATNKTCPDGLHFILVKWPQYPCTYPLDAQCDTNDAPLTEKAMPIPVCKHQYGFYVSPLATRSDCGKYRMCVEGKAYEMECSAGLAFNAETGRCDWPEFVLSCDTEAFLGFKCPPPTYDKSGKPYILNFGIQGSCYFFFSCMEGVARLLLCDPGYAFDKTVNRCLDATRVHCMEDI